MANGVRKTSKKQQFHIIFYLKFMNSWSPFTILSKEIKILCLWIEKIMSLWFAQKFSAPECSSQLCHLEAISSFL